jgi:hypothetical protein
MLKHRNVLVMIVLVLVTFGFYFPIWYLRRRTALNALDSPRKLPLWPFILLLSYVVLTVSVAVLDAGLPPGSARLGDGAIFPILQLGVAIVLIIHNFRIKDILEDHLATTDTDMPALTHASVALSGVLTFILGPFYLQHAINTNLEGLTRTAAPATGAGA